MRSRVHAAYERLLSKDAELLALDANERSITHKLAEYLQVEFPDWHVDCEYNRKGHIPKRVQETCPKTVRTDRTEAVTVYPDIVIHRRNTPDNLAVIEAKKNARIAGSCRDLKKLSAYKQELGYRFAFMIIFPVGGDSSAASAATDIREVDGE